MKKLSFLVLVLFISFSVSAQNWTAEQKEVIEHIKSCWDGWNKAFVEKNFDFWAEVCPCENGHAYWFTNQGAPEMGIDAVKRAMNNGLLSWEMKRIKWTDLRPLSVKIDENVALVHFYAYSIIEDYKGNISQVEQKRFEVFRKKEGKWTLIGGMVTPVSSD